MRVKFKEDIIRNAFFKNVKLKINLPWKNIREKLEIPKKTFEDYLNGKSLMPEIVFNKLAGNLAKKDRKLFLINIIKKEENWGRSKGGKVAYAKNKAFFKIGRIKGLKEIKKRRQINEKNNKINPKLTGDLCEFIGAFIGDGFFNCYKNKLYHIEFSGDSKKDLEYYNKKIIPIVKSIIPGIKAHIRFVKGKNAMRIIFYSKKLFFLLKEKFGFSPGKKVYTVTIPKVIFNHNKKFTNSTIRGIFDTDGGIFLDKRKEYKKPYPRIIFATRSTNLFNQLVKYLKQIFKIYMGQTNRCLYFIEIYGHKQLNKWMDNIGFSNPRHLNKIASVA